SVHRAGLHRGVNLVRRQRENRRAGVLEHHVHLAAAAAHLDPLRIVGPDERPDRLATPPACHIQVTMITPFSAKTCDRNLPISAFFHLLPMSYDGTSAGKRPMLVSGTSPPAYDSGTSDKSSAPRRNALNWEFTLTSDEFGYMSNLS